jgi:uncharacterized protein YbcI
VGVLLDRCSGSSRLLLLPQRPLTEGGAEGIAVSDPQASTGTIAAAISNACVQLLSEYTGRGPTKAKTSINRDLITVVMQDTMTKAEKSLASNGDSQFVLDMRHRFQLTMRDELVGVVERFSERKVIAFMSDNHIDPDMAVEIFVLEPLPATNDGDAA